MILTLEEILDLSTFDGFTEFCSDRGYDTYVVNEGGGDIQVSLTKEDLQKYEIIIKRD